LKHEKTIEHPQGITECAFVEDDQLVITLCVDGSVRIWNIGAGTLFKELKRATAPAASMDIAEKSRRIFVGYADGSIQGWSWVDGSESFRILPRHRDAVRCVAVHENLELLATGSHDRTACIWDLRTGQLLQSLAHGTSVQTVEFSADGASLLSAGRGGQVRLWDCVGGVEQTGPLYHSTDTTAVKYAPDARFIASASTDGSMRIWADSFTAPQKKMRSESPEVKSVVATPTGIAIAICEDGSLGIKPPSSQEIQAIPTPSPVQCIAIAEAGHAWAAGLHDGTILASQDLPASLDGKDVTRWTQSSRPTKIAIAEQAVVTASSSGILTLYRHGIAIPKEFARNATKVHWLNLSPDGKYCAVAAVNRLWIWQIDAAAPMLVAEYSFQGLISAALWTTSTQLALGADKDLNLLDVTSGRVASRQCSSISRLSMDDVHSRLLVSHSNGDLQLLRLPDLESVVPPITRGSVTLSSGFCKGLPLAYTLSGNRALYLWDYTTAQKVFETTVPGETPLAAIPDLEEGSLIICRRDGTFWPVSIDAIQNPQAEIVAWSEIISGCRLDARVGLRPLSPDQLLAAWKSRRVPVIANASQ
jgi:WD40 repeat protein